MVNNPQFLTLEEFARKYNIGNPNDKTRYDYIAAWHANASPDSDGNWPKKYERRDNDSK